MKKINEFYQKSPLWMLFLVDLFIFGGIIFCMYYFVSGVFDTIPNTENIYRTNILKTIGLSFFVGTLISIFSLGTRKKIRGVAKFWDLANIIEKEMNNNDNPNYIKFLLDDRLEELKKLSWGGLHYFEIKRLNDLLRMKLTLLK